MTRHHRAELTGDVLCVPRRLAAKLAIGDRLVVTATDPEVDMVAVLEVAGVAVRTISGVVPRGRLRVRRMRRPA